MKQPPYNNSSDSDSCGSIDSIDSSVSSGNSESSDVGDQKYFFTWKNRQQKNSKTKKIVKQHLIFFIHKQIKLKKKSQKIYFALYKIILGWFFFIIYFVMKTLKLRSWENPKSQNVTKL